MTSFFNGFAIGVALASVVLLVATVANWLVAQAEYIRAKAEHTRSATAANKALSEQLLKAGNPMQFIQGQGTATGGNDGEGITLPGYH